VTVLPLFQDTRETVRLERWTPGAAIELAPRGGVELLVLRGALEEAGEQFVAQSWLRLPAGASLAAAAGPEGCEIWIKTGHLGRQPLERASSSRIRE
jgi:hypothetical protein